METVKTVQSSGRNNRVIKKQLYCGLVGRRVCRDSKCHVMPVRVAYIHLLLNISLRGSRRRGVMLGAEERIKARRAAVLAQT